MKKVNLFIVGAAKAGTSALWKVLSQHPDICVAKDNLQKEPAFFSPLAKRKRMTYEFYHAIFEQCISNKYIIDASTAYLTDPSSAKQIFNYNPKAKILICLRNPVERAYSLYNWMTQEGYEYLTFERALACEEKRSKNLKKTFFQPEYHYNYQYRKSGCYSEQVNRYLQLFNSNVHVMFFEDLKTDFYGELNKISSFLALNEFSFNNVKTNVSVNVKYPLLQFLLRKIIGLIDFFMKKQTKSSRDKLLTFFTSKNQPKKLPPSLEKELKEYFSNDIKKLEEILKRDIVWL